MDPPVDTATIRSVLNTNRVDVGSFSSRRCTFRRTRTSADPIRLFCIRLALPLTFSLPSRFASSARLGVYVSLRALWLSGDSSCDCLVTRGDEDLLGNRWAIGGYSNHDGSNKRNSRELGKF